MNLSELRQSIIDHTWRPDLSGMSGTVDAHINRAVNKIVNERRWAWLEATKTTVTDERSVRLPGDFAAPIRFSVVDDKYHDPLQLHPLSDLRTTWATDDVDEPLQYAIHDGQLWLYPKPDKAYQFELIYKRRFVPLTQDTDTNYVATQFPLLVVYRACTTLFQTVLHDGEASNRFYKLFEDELTDVEYADDEYWRDLGSGMVQPDTFYYELAGHYSRGHS